MKIEKYEMGWVITVPETDHNSEFRYEMPIMRTGPVRIMREQERIARRLAIRAFQMENFFNLLRKAGGGFVCFEAWELRNRLNWNDWFHAEMQMMEEEAQMLQREWYDWHWEKFGWNAY